jgi:hypothetical protein
LQEGANLLNWHLIRCSNKAEFIEQSGLWSSSLACKSEFCDWTVLS